MPRYDIGFIILITDFSAAPALAATLFFMPYSVKCRLSTVEQGLLGVMNDLHRGRDSGAAWAWVIDISAVFLTLISVTGLGILFYLKKSRVAGLIVGLAGLVAVAILSWLASR